MEIELVVTCDCCGLKEDCTQFYISEVKAKFEGKWLCGLCSEAVRDEAKRSKKPLVGNLEEAVNAHMSFCRKFKSNPAVRVADGMRLMLRRRSSDMSSSSSSSSPSSSIKKYGRSASSSQVGFDMSSLSLYWLYFWRLFNYLIKAHLIIIWLLIFSFWKFSLLTLDLEN